MKTLYVLKIYARNEYGETFVKSFFELTKRKVVKLLNKLERNNNVIKYEIIK
jgi:hypothetical protein